MRAPLERTHDISQTGYHIKDLRTFGESLTNAAAGAFPKGNSRYGEAHVLLLSWEEDKLGVMEEINELRSVFNQTYHYHIEEWKIPSKRSHNSLIRRMTGFLDDYERKENLLLVYYGGHGHLNDDRQLIWSCNELEDSPTVQWVGIQNMLEQATSDVLILLDCCAAATASAELGSGVTEVIAACGFETSTPGVCEHSFTRSLIEELRYYCKRSPLSAAILHMKVLSRMKYWKPKTVEIEAGELVLYERRITPVHTILTNEGRPRSIVLSPIESISFLSPEVSASLTLSPSSDCSSQDVEMEDSSNESATTSIPSSVSSPGNGVEQSCPTVLIAVALEEDQRLQLDTWVEWLRDIPAIAKYARVEGIYESNSTLILLSLPVSIWDMIPNSPAVSFIGFIKSQDLLKYQPTESSKAQAAKSAPTSTSPPAVIEALAINDGLTPEKNREGSPCGLGQRLVETHTPQSPEQGSAQQTRRYCENHGLPSDRNDRESEKHDITVEHGRRRTLRSLIPSSQTKFLESQSPRKDVDTAQGGLAEKPTSTSILGSNLKTNTLRDTTSGIQTQEATSSPLRQIYSAVAAAYDTHIQVMDLLSEYQELRTGLMIERYRIELWKGRILAEDENEQGNVSTYVIESWAPFEFIFTKMLETFSENLDTIGEFGAQNSIRMQEGLSGVSEFASFRRLRKRQQTFPSAPLEKKRIERLLKNLCYWNDSLEKLTPALEQESSRRRLRAHFSTSNSTELQNLEAAAAFLNHQDIELMAYARSVIEQERYGGLLNSQTQTPDKLPSPLLPEYRIKASELEWQEVQFYESNSIKSSSLFKKSGFQTDRPRALATYRGESVIIDWQNDSWRRGYPPTFRRQIQSLTTMLLNSGLWPLNLSVLHCVGYLDKGLNMTGYAFRLPPGVAPGQSPVTLHHLLCNDDKTSDIPDLGERFQLAKALVLTLFEIHNLGWLHKNIRPKNILFWPKPNSKDKIEFSKPYLVGFDISRPNQPGEFSEKPLFHLGDDDLYRHPLYNDAEPNSFQPSFDMYSLGVVLYEIGLWRRATVVASQAAPKISRRPFTHPNSDSQYIATLVKNGSVDSLKSFTGSKYRDAVVACLKGEFDDIWEKQEGDRQKQLHTYLDQVQNKVINAIGFCSV